MQTTLPAPRFVFAVTALARGGTLSVMRTVWPSLERHGPVQVISHGPDAVSIERPVISAGGRFSAPMRFPAIWVYLLRMTWACLRSVRGRPSSLLLPQDSIATGAAAGLAGWLTGTPVVVMEHGSAIAVVSDYYWHERIVARRFRDRLTKPILRLSALALHRLCLRLADAALIAGDESAAAYRAAGMPDDRLFHYHFPVDLERFHPATAEERAESRAAFGLPTEAVVVVSISRLTPEKGLDVLVDVVGDLQGTPRRVLAIGGDGPQREVLERRARERGVDARFAGALDPDGVARLLRAGDIFVYAGRQGANTPYAVLEAMASGLAVVATTEPRVHAAMLADGRGIAVAADDQAAMATAVRELVDGTEQRESMGAAARAYVAEHHSAARLDAELDAFVAGIARLRRPRRR
ncbi:MAG TPA: glycosyltransferase family 4 protein [Candidatus Limnocylindria bacterium]|nr:glycosyltransferase family 4 protein [Candidatus Limnocylindria bacterium]